MLLQNSIIYQSLWQQSNLYWAEDTLYFLSSIMSRTFQANLIYANLLNNVSPAYPKQHWQNITLILNMTAPITWYSPLLCSAVAAPVKVILCCLFFMLALINSYRWMKSFWECQADLSRSRHYWLYAACTLSQCCPIHTRPTSFNKLLVGMWTCMPRLTAARKRRLSRSLWGDVDVSYYHCHWNVALF